MNIKSRNYLYLIYGGLFLVLIVSILAANIFLLSQQTQKDFIKMFWRQNGETAEFVALSATQAIEAEHLEPRQINQFTKGLAQKLDQGPLPTSAQAFGRLEEFRQKEALAFLLLYNNQGQLLAESPLGAEKLKGKHPSVAVPRQSGNGALVLGLSEKNLLHLKAKSALQKLALGLSDRKVADYISFIGPDGLILADSEPGRVGSVETNEGIEASLKDGTTYYYRKEDHYEAVHPFAFGNNETGALIVGLDSQAFEEIYQDIWENTTLFSFWVMCIAVVVAAGVWRFNKGYVAKIDQMQAQIAENEKFASLANLAAGVAHEVRNPLNSISITLQRLQLEYEPEISDSTEFHFLTDLMKNEVGRINQIVTDFLGFSKPYSPNFVPFLANEMVRSCIALFSQAAKEKGVEVVSLLPKLDHEIEGDQPKLTQVLLNLLNNALDATPPGGKITVQSRFSPGWWDLEVIDEGEGISKDKLKQIFDIYYTTKATGTGLGLFICRKIVSAHEGKIGLRPNPTQGMTAYLSLSKRRLIG
ncbi:MAG: hypothetical protein A2527_10390 [Candidatus Lambdaproteobacteria bacterium RIFOXYD2_FULL_50_16]|uniref:histidine kinase n=1 Tax=Candidatus Lambdaproteobacteria bacterium RIFOXYD2_FULL_50_16 TaxID=1817772 RepID=A0A1F6GGI3_9PROT|nr:MAG: hypothetical protein A2527_10390 [Candidatus Lambdaproteobacteria bacterium RIFOXYD2_FULL_50_16]